MSQEITLNDILAELSAQRKRFEELEKAIRHRKGELDKDDEALTQQRKEHAEKETAVLSAVNKINEALAKHKKAGHRAARTLAYVRWILALLILALLLGIAQHIWLQDRFNSIGARIDRLPTHDRIKDLIDAKPCTCPEVQVFVPCCGCDGNDDPPPTHKPKKKRTPHTSNGCSGSGAHDHHRPHSAACNCHAAMTTCRPMPVKCCAQQLEPTKADSARGPVPADGQAP